MARRYQGVKHVRITIAVAAALSLFACSETPDESAAAPSGGLTADELAAEPAPWPSVDIRSAPGQPFRTEEAGAAGMDPVTADAATDVRIEALTETTGYVDERGRYVVDLLEDDYAYLAVRLETMDGRPVIGAVPVLSIKGTSRLLQPEEISSRPTTDESGVIEFVVVGGQMGLNQVRAEFGGASTELLVNVISRQALGFPTPPVVEGGLPWEALLEARVEYRETMLVADFPDTVAERAGQTVKLSGFMMPLDPDLKQRRFILTSNPPSCFFHLPGGPAGAVEVFAEEGVEMSWDPVVLEGRFEPQSESKAGVVYRLHDARLVTP